MPKRTVHFNFSGHYDHHFIVITGPVLVDWWQEYGNDLVELDLSKARISITPTIAYELSTLGREGILDEILSDGSSEIYEVLAEYSCHAPEWNTP